MSTSNLHDRVRGVVEHQTNNRVQGPTIGRPNVVRLIARHDADPAAVNDAIDELLAEGELDEPEPDELLLA